MTNRRQEIENRCKAATPGPWSVRSGTLWAGETELIDGRYYGAEIKQDADAEFIAHAREDLPWTLEQLAKVEKERDELRGLLEDAWHVLSAADRSAAWQEERARCVAAIGEAIDRESLAELYATAYEVTRE